MGGYHASTMLERKTHAEVTVLTPQLGKTLYVEQKNLGLPPTAFAEEAPLMSCGAEDRVAVISVRPSI